MYRRLLIKCFTCFLICSPYLFSNAQVIILGGGSFTGSSFAGPCNTSTSSNAGSRYAYIFPQSTVSSLLHNDTIRSLSFMRNGGGGKITGTANMKIFIRTTVNSNYGTGSVNWVNLTGTVGMKKVYDKNPSAEMDSVDGWVRFVFTTPYVVDTFFGKNLEVLVEYTHASAQSSNIFWNFENSGTVNGYGVNQTKFVRTNGGTLTDTTNSSSELHPTIRIEFPRHNFDLSVNKIYSLGKLPVPLGNPDSVRAIIQNVGKKDATFKMYLESKGANKLIDSASYFLPYLGEKTLTLPSLFPTAKGMDTLTVRIQKDDNTANNQASVFRLATENIYNYKDPTTPIVGGIGFNGSTGDFVAKFYSNTAKAINQISVSFAGSNQRFKLGIWEANGPNGSPGKNIWTSDTLQTAPSFITPVLPPVSVSGNFYVGVRQIGTTNVAFGYQPELPVRKGTFYYAAPMGDTNWVDFAPAAPFKFAIEPRLQAVHDIAPTQILVPKDTVKLSNVIKIAPKAKFLNYGSAAQLTPFNVKINIFRYGYLEYTSVRQDTLSVGQSRIVTFDSSFFPVQAGDYDVQAITMLPSDQMKDNDTLRSKFIVAAFKDVGPGTIFDPSNGYDYEQFVDTIYPTVYVQNYGLDAQGPFNVRAEIYDSSNNLIFTDVKSISLTALNSVLVSFKTFPCDVKGRYFFRAFTELGIDVDKANDTVSRFFKIIRSNDVTISSIAYPENNKSLLPPVAPRRPEAVLNNVGEIHQSNSFQVYSEIYYSDSLIYRDSIYINSFIGIPQTLLFRNFQPTLKGYYHMLVYSSLPVDQYRANDTLRSNFAVGVPDDVEIVSIYPPINSALELDSVYETKVLVRNNGYKPQNTPFPVVFKVTNGASIVYLKVKQITIDSGQTQEFVIDTSLRLLNPSSHQVQVYTILNKDFIKHNDSIKGNYNGKKTYDIGVSKILYPTVQDTLLSNTQFVESRVLVKNYGDSMLKETFKTTLRILNKSNQIVLYDKSIDSSFQGADSLELKFPGFSITGANLNIVLQASTSYAQDKYLPNDTAHSESRFMVLYDALAEGIIHPVNQAVYYKNGADIQPQVRIRNQSLKTLDQVLTVLKMVRVDTISLLETEVYADSIIELALMPSELRTTNQFKSFPLSGLDKGVYKAYLSVSHELDQLPANNTQTVVFRIDENVKILEVNAPGFSVYPQPANQKLMIVLNNNSFNLHKLELTDLSGKVLKQGLIESSPVVLDVSDLSSGIYVLRIGNELIKIIVDH